MDGYELHYLQRLSELTVAYEKKIADLTIERATQQQRIENYENAINALRERIGDLEVRLSAHEDIPPPDETAV